MSNGEPSRESQIRSTAEELLDHLVYYEACLERERGSYLNSVETVEEIVPTRDALAGFYPPLNKLPGRGHGLWLEMVRVPQEAARGLPRGLPEHEGDSWWIRKTNELFVAVNDFQQWLISTYDLGGECDGDGPAGDPYDARIQCHEASKTIVLDRVSYDIKTLAAVRLFRSLIDHERRGEVATREKLLKAVFPKSNNVKLIERLRKKLPPALDDCIKSQKGVGIWLRLPELR